MNCKIIGFKVLKMSFASVNKFKNEINFSGYEFREKGNHVGQYLFSWGHEGAHCHGFNIDGAAGIKTTDWSNRTKILLQGMPEEKIERELIHETQTINDVDVGRGDTPVTDTYNSKYSDCLFSLTNLSETFQKCLLVVNKKINSNLWKITGFCPLIKIIDLLILKQNDTDIRIETIESKILDKPDKLDKIYYIEQSMKYLEKTMLTLNEDNKKLMEKIGLLEKEITTLKNIPTAVAVQTFSVGEEMLKDSRF